MTILVLSSSLVLKRLLLVSKNSYSAIHYSLPLSLSLSMKAGADIKEMKDFKYVDTYKKNFLGHWAHMVDISKPIIAAVNGYAVSYTHLT